MDKLDLFKKNVWHRKLFQIWYVHMKGIPYVLFISKGGLLLKSTCCWHLLINFENGELPALVKGRFI